MTSRAPLIGLLVAVLLTAAWWFFLYDPKNDELAEIQVETEALVAQQQQLRNEIAQLRDVEANQVQIRAAIARLEEFIPSGPAQPAVIRQLQESADAAGVDITSVSFAAPAVLPEAPATTDPETALAQIPVTMVMQGGYFQIVDFLRRLEVDVPRAILVNSVTAGEGEDGFPELATTWAGQLFAVVPVAAAPAPEPAPGVTPEPGVTPAPGVTPTATPAAAEETQS